jgi:hypothetical protein
LKKVVPNGDGDLALSQSGAPAAFAVIEAFDRELSIGRP